MLTVIPSNYFIEENIFFFLKKVKEKQECTYLVAWALLEKQFSLFISLKNL